VAIYVYRPTGDGGVKAQEVAVRPKLRGTPPEATKGFHQTILDAYKEVEANGEWRGPYPKGYVKRVHEEAMVRDERLKA
jgi:hypothetical protein